MAIRFGDVKREGAKEQKIEAKLPAPVTPEAPAAEADSQPLFAKPKRPEKKRKGR